MLAHVYPVTPDPSLLEGLISMPTNLPSPYAGEKLEKLFGNCEIDVY
jgi:hypothetical protein